MLAASQYARSIDAYLTTPAGRTHYVEQLRTDVVQGLLKTTSSAVTASLVRERTLKIGDATAELVTRFSLGPVSLYVGELFLQEKRVFEALSLFSTNRITPGDTAALADLVVTRIDAALAPPPSNTSAPTISGTPRPGRILAAKPGKWNGRNITYAYQWLRCHATPDSCTPITGAVSSDYVVRAADRGFPLAVKVRATNPAGATNATSSLTAAIGS